MITFSVRKCLLASIACCLVGCASKDLPGTAAPAALQISDLKSGLVDFKGGEPYVSKQGDAFPYVDSGVCEVSGRLERCQWHGFSFSYKGASEETQIDCVIESSRKIDIGDPVSRGERNVTTSDFSFTLPGRSGTYVRPQYTSNLKGQPLQRTTRCAHQGHEVFRFSLTLVPSK